MTKCTNQNGVSDAGELQTLAEAGITQIALTRTDTLGTLISRARLRHDCHGRGFAATFTRADGTRSTMESDALVLSSLGCRIMSPLQPHSVTSICNL